MTSRKRLDDGEVGDVALVLLELPGDEDAALATIGRCSSCTTDDLPMPEEPDTSTSSGVPLATTRSNASCKSGALGGAAVQLLRDEEAIGDVALAEREGRDLSRSSRHCCRQRSRSWARPDALW